MASEHQFLLTKKEIHRLCAELAAPYKVTDGKGFKLSKYKPSNIGPFSKKHREALLEKFENGVNYLESLQDLLYADSRYSLLIVLQAMDAAGKDGTIKHVMGGVNPQGCEVHSFKKPSSEEHRHDYLWRCVNKLPERGMIGIFNRSYYEEVLSVRVHPEWLDAEGLDGSKATEKFWKQRFTGINNFEKHLHQNSTRIIKIFLNVSKEEQRKRLLSRLDTPEKNWKFSPDDVVERRCWKEYQHAFEETIKHTASEEAPWYVVPADNKWFSRIVVLCAIIDQLASLKLKYPKVSDAQMKTFEDMRTELEKK